MLLERGSSSQSDIIISLAVKPLAADDGEVHLEEAGLWLLLNSLPFSASLALEAAVAARSLSKLLVLPKESVDSQHSIIQSVHTNFSIILWHLPGQMCNS